MTTQRLNKGIDPKRCPTCNHTGTVHHLDDSGKRYCVVCHRSGADNPCAKTSSK